MHQRVGLFSSPSIRFQRIIKAGNLSMNMRLHRTTNDLRDFTKAKAMVEECLDGNLVRRIHRGRHGATDSKRFVPEVEARKAVMVGFTEGQLPDFRQVQ